MHVSATLSSPSPDGTHDRAAALMDNAGLRAVEARMVRLTSGEQLDPAGEIAREHLLGGGRRIRARLALAAGEALGLERAELTGWAAACELLHNATLVHDDIQDGDRMRRDAPTAWSLHGVGQAINAGDLLLMLPFLAVSELTVPGNDKARLSEALARAATRTARGQSVEMALLHQDRVGWEDWCWAAEGKSGALLGLPVVGAAVLAGLDDRTANALGASFTRVGVLYQLQDDLLDLTWHKGHGRRAGDIREGKITSLIALHLEGVPKDREWLLEVLRTPSQRNDEATVEAVVARLLAAGTIATAMARIEAETRLILEAPVLAAVPPLHAVAQELVNVVRASAKGALEQNFRNDGVVS